MGFQEALALRECRHHALFELVEPRLTTTVLETVDIKRKNVLLLIAPKRPSKDVFQAALQRVIIDIEDVVMNQKAWMTGSRVIIQHQRHVVDEHLLSLNAVTAVIVNVICELGWRRPHDFLPLAPRLFELLVDGGNNWMAIKLIKLVRITMLEKQCPG